MDPDQTVPAPPDAAQPGARGRNGTVTSRRLVAVPESVEPWRRRAGVQPRWLMAQMLAEVHQHVNQPVSHFARSGQRPGVVTVVPDATRPPQRPVHRAGHPDGQPADPQRQRPGVGPLDHQVQVIRLYGKVHQAKRRRAGGGKRNANRTERVRRSEGRDVGPRAKSDVYRVSLAMDGPRPVRRRSPSSSNWLAPSPGTRPSPAGRPVQGQLRWSASGHLNKAIKSQTTEDGNKKEGAVAVQIE
jgi:hypothetical protein